MGNLFEPKVSIVVVNLNGEDDTFECVDSLKKIGYKNYEIVVVDNGSSKKNYERLKKNLKGVTILRKEENLGFTGGYNVGIRYAKASGSRYVAILNNDTVVDEKWLSEFVKLAKEEKKFGVIGSKSCYYGQREIIQTAGLAFNKFWATFYEIGNGLRDEDHYNENREVTAVSGVSMLMDLKNPLEDILFDEELFLYYEDVDLCLRMKRNGYKVLYCAKSKVYHKISRTAKKVKGLSLYWGIRNRLRVIRRYYGFIPYVWVFIRLLVKGVVDLSVMDKVSAKAYFRGLCNK
ncbi:glycosyltransferase family 2 protein [Candidatus Dojkabacteria bacterium]|nr:glycosyltransferase family 2 protein [Candidatus Dojkabacteria bacterium]